MRVPLPPGPPSPRGTGATSPDLFLTFQGKQVSHALSVCLVLIWTISATGRGLLPGPARRPPSSLGSEVGCEESGGSAEAGPSDRGWGNRPSPPPGPRGRAVERHLLTGLQESRTCWSEPRREVLSRGLGSPSCQFPDPLKAAAFTGLCSRNPAPGSFRAMRQRHRERRDTRLP